MATKLIDFLIELATNQSENTEFWNDRDNFLNTQTTLTSAVKTAILNNDEAAVKNLLGDEAGELIDEVEIDEIVFHRDPSA